MQIDFIRHGQSTANAVGLWQGQGSSTVADSPLTDEGEEQARLLGERLAGTTYDLVVASDLLRARQTAAALGYPVEIDPSWRELNLGQWEGLPISQADVRYGEIMDDIAEGKPVRFGETGETLGEIAERAWDAIEVLAARLEPGMRAAVVTHGGLLDAVVARFWGFDARRRRYAWFTNTSLTSVEFSDRYDTWRLARFNDASHLGSAPAANGDDPVTTLIRHGRSEANANGLWAGTWDVPLHEDGLAEIDRLARWLPVEGLIATSPLRRARDTAAVLGPGATVVDDLAEMDMGRWEGVPGRDVIPTDLYARIASGEDLARGETGETWADTAERVGRALSEIEGSRTVVGHGVMIHAYLGGLLGLDWAEARRTAFPANTSITRISHTPGGPVVADYNVVGHL